MMTPATAASTIPLRLLRCVPRVCPAEAAPLSMMATTISATPANSTTGSPSAHREVKLTITPQHEGQPHAERESHGQTGQRHRCGEQDIGGI